MKKKDTTMAFAPPASKTEPQVCARCVNGFECTRKSCRDAKDRAATQAAQRAAEPRVPPVLTVEDQHFCAITGLDHAAFELARREEIADNDRFAADGGSLPAKPIVAPKAVLTEADRRFCARMQIDEKAFLATRQQELDDAARAEAYRRS